MSEGEIPHGTIIGRGSGLIAAPVWNYDDHFDRKADEAAFLALAKREKTYGRPRTWKLTPEQIEEAIHQYLVDKDSVGIIAERFGVRQQSMRSLLMSRGVKMRSRSEARRVAFERKRELAEAA